MTGKEFVAGRRLTVAALLAAVCAFGSGEARADCTAFQAEAEAVSGIVPKFDEQGRLRSLLAFGSSSFIAPKQSLIDKARDLAELKAKRGFSEWLSQTVSSSTAVAEMVEIAETTTQTGDTQGVATELTKQLTAMASNTQATLKGLVKLDECVDTAKAVVMVQLGWRADLQKAAEGGGLDGQAEVEPAPETSKINPATGYRVKSPLKDGF